MNYELLIDGVRVDLNRAIPFPITYSIADFKNPEQRKRSRSKSVELPGTRNNCSLFASTFQLSLSPDNDFTSIVNFDPTAKTTAQYYVGGVLVFDGLMKLNTVKISKGDYSFSITLYSNVVNIIKGLEDKTLRELSWEEYNHRLTIANLALSWNTSVNVIPEGNDPDDGVQTANFSGSAQPGFANGYPEGWGYVYPVVEYGYPRTAMNTFKTNDLLPMVYIRECMQKIFQENFDLTIDSDHLDSALVRRMVIGSAPGQKIELTDAEISERLIVAESAIQRTDNLNFPPTFGSAFNFPNPRVDGASGAFPDNPNNWYYNFSKTVYAGALRDSSEVNVTVINDDLSQLNTTTGQIIIQATGTYRLAYFGPLRARLQFTDPGNDGFTWGGFAPGFSSEANRGLRLIIYRNGVEIDTQEFQVNNLISQQGSNANWVEFTFSSQIILDLNAGDTIDFSYSFEINTALTCTVASGLPIPPAPPTPEMTIEIEPGASDLQFRVESQDGELDDGDAIELSRFVPELKQSDFVKAIIFMFNYYVDDPDPVTGSIKMEPLEDYYQADVEAIDWTDKVDYSKTIELLPASTIEGKTYSFKFKDGTDYDNKTYRDQWGLGYGNRDYIVPSTFVTGTKKFELPIEQSIPVRLRTVAGAPSPDITSIIAPRIISGNPEVGDIEPHKGAARIYVYNGLIELPTSPQEYFKLTEISTPGTFTEYENYPCVNHQDALTEPTFDLNFNYPKSLWETWDGTLTNNNLWTFHSKFIRELTETSSLIFRAYMKITEQDIAQLDFSRLIKIDNTLFRLNEIKDWDMNSYQSCKVELLKVIEL